MMQMSLSAGLLFGSLHLGDSLFWNSFITWIVQTVCLVYIKETHPQCSLYLINPLRFNFILFDRPLLIRVTLLLDKTWDLINHFNLINPVDFIFDTHIASLTPQRERPMITHNHFCIFTIPRVPFFNTCWNPLNLNSDYWNLVDLDF